MENSIRKEFHEMVYIFSDEFKKMLDEEYEDYQRTGNAVPKEEVDKLINDLLYNKA